jgi:hypothetical protein
MGLGGSMRVSLNLLSSICYFYSNGDPGDQAGEGTEERRGIGDGTQVI